jgi:hypothetical protein
VQPGAAGRDIPAGARIAHATAHPDPLNIGPWPRCATVIDPQPNCHIFVAVMA